jgi:DNA-binding transcriptional MerR regulator/methylmalonyl-CoA mutase cobalamin-binding subunit
MPDRTYRIHIAAELSGVRVELIRAWERRYGFPRPQRTPSGYRVYTQQDVALLKRLKQLTEEGVAIREAMKMLPQLQRRVAETGEVQVGEVSPTSLEAWRAAVMDAAEANDQSRVSAVLDEVLSALPPLKAFEEVLAPVQCEVGERWHAGRLTVVQEHLVSQVVRARMVSLLHAAPENAGARHAVLACFPEEQHEVGLLGLALRLRHAGLRVTLLGQRVPAADLGKLVTELRPDLVCLSAVTNLGAEPFENLLAQILAALPKELLVWVGGPAAGAYAETCQRLGARAFRPGDDWAALLG